MTRSRSVSSAKTRSLEEKNRELEILYEIVAFLRRPNDVDTLCKGFLERAQKTLGASASSARLLDLESRNLCMIVHDGLGDDFLDREEVLACGECVCGEAAQGSGSSLTLDVRNAALAVTRDACRRAGFRTVSATSITSSKRALGVFNLYFDQSDAIGDADRQLRGPRTAARHRDREPAPARASANSRSPKSATCSRANCTTRSPRAWPS